MLHVFLNQICLFPFKFAQHKIGQINLGRVFCPNSNAKPDESVSQTPDDVPNTIVPPGTALAIDFEPPEFQMYIVVDHNDRFRIYLVVANGRVQSPPTGIDKSLWL